MKIGILTQPLRNNYGGILQAYALQKVLNDKGHEVFTINVESIKSHFHLKVLSILKRIILNVFRQNNLIIRAWPTAKEKRIIAKNTLRFIQENIKTTSIKQRQNVNSVIKEYNFDAVIVGSDQVWRPLYSPYLPIYFLDFLKSNNNILKLSYAASFGVDEWEYSNKQTAMAKALIKTFNAVSVREDTAVKLCKEKLGANVEQVLDPTLLLNMVDYTELVENDQSPKNKGSLLTYVLDQTLQKEEIIKRTAIELGLTPFTVMPEKKFSNVGKKQIDKCIFPPVTAWIRGFIEAEFVITDSFHGTVFSLIFNKPFISVANKNRGLTRFTSLLKLFQLEQRLVFNADELNSNLLYESIDFENVNKIIESQKKKSLDFLNLVISSYD